jgi:hypothetical protein
MPRVFSFFSALSLLLAVATFVVWMMLLDGANDYFAAPDAHPGEPAHRVAIMSSGISFESYEPAEAPVTPDLHTTAISHSFYGFNHGHMPRLLYQDGVTRNIGVESWLVIPYYAIVIAALVLPVCWLLRRASRSA